LDFFCAKVTRNLADANRSRVSCAQVRRWHVGL